MLYGARMEALFEAYFYTYEDPLELIMHCSDATKSQGFPRKRYRQRPTSQDVVIHVTERQIIITLRDVKNLQLWNREIHAMSYFNLLNVPTFPCQSHLFNLHHIILHNLNYLIKLDNLWRSYGGTLLNDRHRKKVKLKSFREVPRVKKTNKKMIK